MVQPYPLNKRFSQTLLDLAGLLPPEGLKVRSLMEMMGERGRLMLCIILALPCVLPIPVPGISVPQGLMIALIVLGLVAGRSPWLPRRLLDFHFSSPLLERVFRRGAAFFRTLEGLSRPRLLGLSAGPVMHWTNGLVLLFSALLLAAPFPIPFSNVLPAYAVIFLAFGALERDGWLILLGHSMVLASLLYISSVFTFGAVWLRNLL